MTSEMLEVYEDELPCDLSEVPEYLTDILVSELEDDEKYAAIERYTLMRDRHFYKIDWPEPEAGDVDDLLQAELDYYEDIR